MAGTISDAGNPDTAGCFVSAVIGTNVTGITQSSTTESMTLSGSNAYNGPITISSGTFTLGGAGVLGSGTYTGSISNSGLLIFGSSAEQTWSGIISGSGSFTDKGAGILTLQGANTYTGSTTVASGAVLLVNQSLSSGGVLGGSGTIGTSVTVNSGGEISFNVTSGGVAGLSIQGNLATTGTIYVSPTIVSGSLNSGTYVVTSFTGTLTGSPTFDWVPSEGGPSATISTSTPGEIKITVP
jgi:autotransporter-associated beta strand protein